jgi:hypothetical protein
MRSIISKFVLAPVALAAIALATPSAKASEVEIRVTVPFSFSVNGKICPAGRYSIIENNIGGLVTLRGVDAPRAFSWIVRPGEPAPNDTHVTLRFDQQNQGYSLRTVQFHNLITSRLDKKAPHSEHNPVRSVEGQ